MPSNSFLRATASLLTRAEADERATREAAEAAEASAEIELLRIAGTFGRDAAAAEAFWGDFYTRYPRKVEALAAWREARQA